MQRIPAVLFFLLLFPLSGTAQQVIGLPKEEVMKVIQEEYKNFALDNTSKNITFNYLKYIDKLNEQTLLCMLSEKDICTSVKLISDYMNLEERIDELNRLGTRLNDSTWTYLHNKQKFVVKLKKEEWFFSLHTKPDVK
jgi:hypothetical protein